MQWKQRLPLAFLAAVFGVLLFYALQPQPLLVSTALVNRASLQMVLSEEGRTRARQVYEVRAPVAGEMARLHVQSGDQVAQGDKLATIRPLRSQPLDARQRAVLQQQVAAADANLAALQADTAGAQSELDLARAEWQRTVQLHRNRLVSDSALDQAQRALSLAEARAQSARDRQQAARFERAALAAQLANVKQAPGADTVDLSAPIQGQVLRRQRESGGVVQAGEVLLTLADVRDQEIVADLLSDQAVQVRPGMPVRVMRWGGEQVLAGMVQRVEPSGFTQVSALGVEEQRVSIIIDWVTPWAERRALGDGYRVEVEILLNQLDNVLQIPANAVFRLDDGWGVYVLTGGVARQRVVETGQRSGLQVEVRAGLEAGEQVITHPDNRLSDGVKVTAVAG